MGVCVCVCVCVCVGGRAKYLCKNLGVKEGEGRLLEGSVFLGTYGMADNTKNTNLFVFSSYSSDYCDTHYQPADWYSPNITDSLKACTNKLLNGGKLKLIH